MAVLLERLEIGIAVVDEVHLHAVDDLVHAAAIESELLDEGLERARDRMLRVAGEEVRDLGAPPRELGAGDPDVAHLVGDVVHLAAESVERRDRAPLLRRQEEEAVVEARAARGRFLLAVFVGRHWGQTLVFAFAWSEMMESDPIISLI